ncbi:hypothetical protein PsorP6_004541 [Peronosclerospora sorghi]|uniref:Uncharacterized protein n=1 Tax=Peronosclerospora sorghi TaxID=230839 RepID=A0ACC0VLW7_9STRA|nr:hypothetical protein PsorP6_004541 [Peronosclerospora sorghi]
MAAKFCLQLEMVVLPGKRDIMVNDAAVRSVMKILSGALQRNTEGSFRCIYKLELDWCAGSQQEEMFIEVKFPVRIIDDNDRESDEEDEEMDLWHLVDPDDELIAMDEVDED